MSNRRNAGSYVFRGSNGKDYVVKSSSWSGGSLAITPVGRAATIKGKVRVIVITRATGKRSTLTNLPFQLDVTDNGSPGTNDTFAISVWNGKTLWHQAGTSTAQIPFGGGNILMHKQ
jgi:hypothetical protein